jgi:ATP synthase F1 complex assembly factor 1
MLFRRVARTCFTYPSPRKLREIMQMSLIERESPDTINRIWEDYHAEKPENVAMSFQSNIYAELNARLKESNMFMLPIKRDGGHFMLISQTQDNSILFTSLENYKAKQIFADPIFIFTFFEELMNTKGLVLGRGDIIHGQVTRHEARDLLKTMFMYYLTPDLYEDFVQTFNFDSTRFDYKKYCKDLNIQSH